ncbi:ABC transporter permease [Pseudoxanthomonas winnipegensis]|uniref:ABC transporter permease n=1 Tax=Pseudoxanthomonas winnipegensis TaxID=2480810 RepID=UPI00102DE08C|nr:ABC transporter permease [Pseudoxanthomonas winnipegensis]TAA44354.1 ABC transporter permease [Pseudoxanthomonas winnipegensis]
MLNNEAFQHDASPVGMLRSLCRHWRLVLQLSRREIVGRYRGSLAGVAWSFFNPLLMLVIYTLVFSSIFKVRWGTGAGESKADFALILFVGLMLHGFFADCLSRAPNLVLANVSYVKKVVFPLELLPWVSVLSALFHLFVSVLVLLTVQLLLDVYLPATALLLPLLLVPFIMVTVALSFVFAAVGVYLRDIGQLTAMITTVLFFLSPIVYPTSSLPPGFQPWIKLSPITYPVEQARRMLIFGELPQLSGWFIYMAVASVLLMLSFYFYQKTRKGFADVL